ncbi:flippase [bacterium]|nr:flippase [bacterium]
MLNRWFQWARSVDLGIRRQGLQVHNLIQNMLALYGLHFARYLIPLVTIPYLTRVLGPESWGILAFSQGFAAYLALFVEYGFDLSATREVARNDQRKSELAELIGNIIGAKLFLVVIAAGVALLAFRMIPIFQGNSTVMWACVMTGILQAMNFTWFFQGMEKMRLISGVDISGKVLAAVALLILVHSPEDLPKAALVQLALAALTQIVAWIMVNRVVSPTLPKPAGIMRTLQMGWTMFLFRASSSLYTAGNTFILGTFATPTQVGFYAGAEKISKSFFGLLGPISQAFYPRLSRLAGQSRDDAKALFKLSVRLMGAGGVFLGLVVFFGAPWLVSILLGPTFQEAVPVLRILALLPPLIALSNVLGIQWMLPLGLDRVFNSIIITAGLLNLCLAAFLAPAFAQVGMAIAVVLAEFFVTACMIVVLRRLQPKTLPVS